MKNKQAVLVLYKNRGETPLECLERFKIENPEYKNEKMTYAGRLDPLAEGLLLVLVGEECKNKPPHPFWRCIFRCLINSVKQIQISSGQRLKFPNVIKALQRRQNGCGGKEKYLGLDKEYEVDILFGFATDTYDILGLVASNLFSNSQEFENKLSGEIKNILKSFVGKFSQKYPHYSSKYFAKARSGELNDEEIDTKDVEIKNIELLGERKISKEDLEKYIKKSVDLVKGDFRQNEILKTWESTLNSVIPAQAGIQVEFLIISIRVNCTSGTYMRSLANSIGEKVGVPALALNIKRTRIGGSL